MPIPAGIKEHTLLNRKAKLIPIGLVTAEDGLALIKAAQSGVPEGAASSPMLASAFLGRELRAIWPGAKVALFTFSDNIIIGARTATEVEAFANALVERLSTLSAGPLHIKISEIQDVRHRADLLGWRFKMTFFDQDGCVRVCPRQRSFYRFERRLLSKLSGWDGDYWQKSRDYSHRWAASYGWQLVPLAEEYLSYTVGHCCSSEDRRRAKAAAAVNAKAVLS